MSEERYESYVADYHHDCFELTPQEFQSLANRITAGLGNTVRMVTVGLERI